MNPPSTVDPAEPTPRSVQVVAKPPRHKPTLWSLLGRVPYWATVGGAFVLGCALLMAYLVSIDYVPHELLSLLGLATLVSAWLALLWLFATVFLFGPVFTVMLYDVAPPSMWVILAGLTSGTGLLLWGIGLHRPFDLVLLAVGIAAGVACAVGLWLEQPRRSFGQGFLAVAAMLLGGALLPLSVMLLAITAGVSEPSAQWSNGWRLAGYVGLLAALIVTNARAAGLGRAPIGLWMIFAAVAAVLYVAVAGWQAVPRILAERVGIRLAGTSTILVPAQTCQLVATALSPGNPKLSDGLVASCSAQVSTVRASVQLRWAGRMLLSVNQLNGIDVPPGAARVTVPDGDAQLVLRAGKP